MPQLEKTIFFLQVLPLFFVLAVLSGFLNREHYIIFDWKSLVLKRKHLLLCRVAWFTGWGFYYRGQKGQFWSLLSTTLALGVGALYQTSVLTLMWDSWLAFLMTLGLYLRGGRCGCRWVYEREVQWLIESGGPSSVPRRGFGDRFYSVAATNRLVRALGVFTRRTGVSFSYLIDYLRSFVGFLPATGVCDRCYVAKRAPLSWDFEEPTAAPLRAGALGVAVEKVGVGLGGGLSEMDSPQPRPVGGAGVEAHFPLDKVFESARGVRVAPYVPKPEEVLLLPGSRSFKTPLWGTVERRGGIVWDPLPFCEEEVTPARVSAEAGELNLFLEEGAYEEDEE